MVKKRPRSSGWPRTKETAPSSKMEPGYWRDRLFRNTFTYRGKRFKVSHWSVKIQHLGARKTFSLRASDSAEAANEACQIYRHIVSSGWDGSVVLGPARVFGTPRPALPQLAVTGTGFEPGYWMERLIHRKYTEKLHAQAERELSVRIEHSGTSHYFPLGTSIKRSAADRAVQIYRTVAGQGWATANERFPRELCLALRWADNPVAWTYTTIHSQPTAYRTLSGVSGRSPTAKLNVAVAEADAAIRNALSWWLNQQGGCSCVATFDSVASALRETPRLVIHLLVVSESLPDKPATVCLEELKRFAPKTSGLLFSAYEDADHLFRSAPGGAAGYLFRRTPPDRILEPATGVFDGRAVTRDRIADSVRHYFNETVSSLAVGRARHELSSLTQREQEILALLSKGHPDKEIADLLCISTWTVHAHLKKIFEKLGAHNRTDAVVKYLNK